MIDSEICAFVICVVAADLPMQSHDGYNHWLQERAADGRSILASLNRIAGRGLARAVKVGIPTRAPFSAVTYRMIARGMKE